MIDFIIVMSGSNIDKITGKYKEIISGIPAPYTPLNDRFLVDRTLDKVVRANSRHVINVSNLTQWRNISLKSRSITDDNGKQIHPVEGVESLGGNFFYGIEAIPEILGMPKMRGDPSEIENFINYLNIYPQIKDISVMVVPSDVPFTSYQELNKAIEYFKQSKDQFNILFATKDRINQDLDKLDKIKPGFKEEFNSLRSTQKNNHLLGQWMRLANIYIGYPFRFYDHMFNLISELYISKDWKEKKINFLRMADIIFRYGSLPKIRKDLPEIAYQVGKIFITQEHSNIKRLVPEGLIGYYTRRNGAPQNRMEYLCTKVTGLQSAINLNAGIGMRFDIDDRDSLEFAEKNQKILVDYAKN